MIKFLTSFALVLGLTGCPVEDNPSGCRKTMVCEEDQEMLCQKNDSGCGEDCNYFTYEHCYEVCRPVE